MKDAAPLTQLLQQAHAGDAGAADRAYALLYPELLKIARSRLRVQRAPTLLDTHALVHESFLRFVGGTPIQLQSRKHFYAYAAKAMRHIVIDFVRRAQTARRGGDQPPPLTLDTARSKELADSGQAAQPLGLDGVAALEEALASLEAMDAGLAELVELRFYGGYTDIEVAAALGLSERSVRRQWDKARAFLALEMQP
jgi:RNA polymerase sigma factor (TIGR02999 family)